MGFRVSGSFQVPLWSLGLWVHGVSDFQGHRKNFYKVQDFRTLGFRFYGSGLSMGLGGLGLWAAFAGWWCLYISGVYVTGLGLGKLLVCWFSLWDSDLGFGTSEF